MTVLGHDYRTMISEEVEIIGGNVGLVNSQRIDS